MKKALWAVMEKRGHPENRVTLEPIPADGSTRMFWRMHLSEGDSSVVVMVNPPRDAAVLRENQAYLKIGIHLKEKGLPVPEIYEFDLAEGWFMMEDLGNRNLQDVVNGGADPLGVYEAVLDDLVRLQTRGAEGFDPAWCCQTRQYDHTVMRRYESDYFKEAFLHHYLGLSPRWLELEGAFEHLAHRASQGEARFFLHRDFQSRNILLCRGKIGVVDWQGGRVGPLGYDLASLLIDPYAGLTPEQQHTLYRSYRRRIAAINGAWAESLDAAYPYLAIQRNLQILGAFSHLTKVMHKTHFEAHIPRALRGLHRLLDRMDDGPLIPLKDLVSHVRDAHGQVSSQVADRPDKIHNPEQEPLFRTLKRSDP